MKSLFPTNSPLLNQIFISENEVINTICHEIQIDISVALIRIIIIWCQTNFTIDTKTTTQNTLMNVVCKSCLLFFIIYEGNLIRPRDSLLQNECMYEYVVHSHFFHNFFAKNSKDSKSKTNISKVIIHMTLYILLKIQLASICK